MPTLHFLPDNKTYSSKYNTTILKASKRAGVLHQRACGGRGRCSTCRVKIEAGLENCHPRNSREKKIASLLGFNDDVRLACQTVVTGDVKVKRLVLDEIDVQIAHSRAKSKKQHPVGEEVEVTLVFMDLYDFTSFTEKTQPYDVVHLLNRYYFIAGMAVNKYGGAILDYYGDGILAIFGHKNENSHAAKALHASREIIAGMDKFNRYVNLITDLPMRMRVGIHTGKVVLGTMGMPGFEKLAVVGDDVNIASRIEYANKKFGTTLLISENTKQFLPPSVDYVNEYEVKLKGKASSIKVYQVI